MTRMAWLVVAAVLMTHVLLYPVAQLADNPARAWENLYYVMRGVEGAVLLMAIVGLTGRYQRRTFGRWSFCVVCVVGAFCELMAAVCGAAYMAFGADSAGVGLCERTQGWSGYALMAGAAILAAVSYGLDHG